MSGFGEAIGEARGRLAGRKEVLLQLMGQKFGKLTAGARRRLENATDEELDRWSARILTATSLKELLDG